MTDIDVALTNMRNYYNEGHTKTYDFRKSQLKKLKHALTAYESEIEKALFADLKKNQEEAYATETGLVLAEINVALKNLKRWMKPKRARTNLVNLPSSSKIYKDPLGVVLIIAPWNYPLQLLLIPLVGAIAGGNCVVLKPSEFSAATTAVIEKMIREIFPGTYIKVVSGDGAEVVPAIMQSFRFDHIFYTGSTAVGKTIYKMAAEKLTPVTLELGGKSPAIIHADANVAVAAKRIVFGKFLNTGQTCITPDYVLVHRDVQKQFIACLKEAILQFYSHDASSDYNFGKIINEKRFDKLVTYLSDGKIILGGEHDKSKLYIEPTILIDVATNSPVMKEEIFGPILPVLIFDTTNEAMNIVEQNATPLAFYLFSNDKNLQQQWIEKIPFGGGCINNADWQFANHYLPFGGVGNSGLGAYHGKYSFDTFTRLKPVMKTPNWFDPAIKYPPMKGKLKLFKWVIR